MIRILEKAAGYVAGGTSLEVNCDNHLESIISVTKIDQKNWISTL